MKIIYPVRKTDDRFFVDLPAFSWVSGDPEDNGDEVVVEVPDWFLLPDSSDFNRPKLVAAYPHWAQIIQRMPKPKKP
jgi:hypothetical protein